MHSWTSAVVFYRFKGAERVVETSGGAVAPWKNIVLLYTKGILAYYCRYRIKDVRLFNYCRPVSICQLTSWRNYQQIFYLFWRLCQGARYVKKFTVTGRLCRHVQLTRWRFSTKYCFRRRQFLELSKKSETKRFTKSFFEMRVSSVIIKRQKRFQIRLLVEFKSFETRL